VYSTIQPSWDKLQTICYDDPSLNTQNAISDINKVWRSAFAMDWNGDLEQLPLHVNVSHCQRPTKQSRTKRKDELIVAIPTKDCGLLQIKSRCMFIRLRNLVNRQTHPAFKRFRDELVHVPMRNRWLDLIDATERTLTPQQKLDTAVEGKHIHYILDLLQDDRLQSASSSIKPDVAWTFIKEALTEKDLTTLTRILTNHPNWVTSETLDNTIHPPPHPPTPARLFKAP
jgi:hypothetical protein